MKTLYLIGVLQFLGNILSYLNPFSENFILRGVLDFLGNILSYINPFSDNFILKGVLSFLGSILDYLNPFSNNFIGIKLIELLGDLLRSLFVPSEDSFIVLKEVFEEKLGFVTTIKGMIQSIQNMVENVEELPSITVNVPQNRFGVTEVTVINLSWYAPYKAYGDLIITGFAYLFFIWRIYKNLPSILSGVSSISGEVGGVEK